MAKTLEKVTKEYRTIACKLDDVVQQIRSMDKNRKDLENLANEYARGAAEAAIELKSKGHAGKTIGDFRDEPEVKKLQKLWEKQRATAAQLLNPARTASKEYFALMAKLNAIVKELTDEIANREKKANRVIFKIKSESLPDLKKLKDEVQKKVDGLVDDQFAEDAKALPEDVALEFTSFEDIFEKEFGRSRKERQGNELFEKGVGAKNIRVQIKYQREGQQMESEIKKLCAEALKAAKRGESAKPYLDEAVKIYRNMSEVAKIQQRAMKMEEWQKKTKDGKKVYDSAVAYVDMSKKTLTLLTKTTSATMPAPPNAKTKKTPPPIPARKDKEKKDKGKEKINV